MCKPHRCPHIAMTGNICVYVRRPFYHKSNIYSFIDIAPVAQIPISITVPKATQAMNPLRCVPYGHGMIPTNRPEVGWNNLKLWDTVLTR